MQIKMKETKNWVTLYEKLMYAEANITKHIGREI